ncbi:MAG: class I SAM-dependent methyltransferase [Candidatus Hodarchaeota archaeon]
MNQVKKDIKQYYDKTEAYYTKFLSKAGQYFKNRKINVFQKFMNSKEGSKILEVGCADGVFTLEFAKMNSTMIGLDLSKKQLLKLMKISKNLPYEIHTVLGDAESLPFKSDSIDTIISISTIRYVPNPQSAILDFARVVKQGGRVVVDFPNKYSPYFLFLKQLFLKRHPHDSPFSVGEVKRLFKKSNLSSIQFKLILITAKFFPDWVFPWIHVFEKLIEEIPLLNRLASIIVCAGKKV